MNTEYTRKVVEAAMLAAGRSLSLVELAQLFDPVDRPDNEQLRAALDELAQSYDGRGVELLETASGFRVQIRREVSEQVSRLWPERPPRYSRALLETLAIIAYRQPLTRAEIEAIRGVAVNPNIIKTLFDRNWIRVLGHREVPGRPELLGTTRDFLDYFGLKKLDQLPPLAELKSLEQLDPQMLLPEPIGVVVDGGDGAEADPEAAAGPAGETAAGLEIAAGVEGTAGIENAADIAETADSDDAAGLETAANDESAADSKPTLN